MFLKLAGYIYWQLISRFSSLKKELYSGFWNNAKFVGMVQITYKNCNKSSWMQVNKILLSRDRPDQFPPFLVRSFQWYQTTMTWSRVSKACHFLKILANCVDSTPFHCFQCSKTCRVYLLTIIDLEIGKFMKKIIKCFFE